MPESHNEQPIGTIPELVNQNILQKEALKSCQLGDISEALYLINYAADKRDFINRPGTSDVWSVESSLSFNQSLLSLFAILRRAGKQDYAESIAASRLRTSANPYEIIGLLDFASTYQANKSNFDSAIALAKDAEVVARDIGSPWLVARIQNSLGLLYESIKDEPNAMQYIAASLDSLEQAESSTLFYPEEYKVDASYEVKHRLRQYIGSKMFFGRDREAMHFCNEALTKSSHPSRLGFFHYWMGQAEILRSTDRTKATLHLMQAEDYFIASSEPVYVALSLVDQAQINHSQKSLEKAVSYATQAQSQAEASVSYSLKMEVTDMIRELEDAMTLQF